MKVIYEPKGRAREYAPLAANLYTGCTNGCQYCYAPACLRRQAEDFYGQVTAREGVIAALTRDADELRASAWPAPVFLCFTCDPWPRCPDVNVTRDALIALGSRGIPVRVLTKNAWEAQSDFDLMKLYGVEFGVSLVWNQDVDRARWEPGADTVVQRGSALMAAKTGGLRTWVSVEPVIDPKQAYHVVHALREWVDVWKLGAWNHDARAKDIDYARFLRQVMPLLREAAQAGRDYTIKHDLWRHADDETRANFPRTTIHSERSEP